MKSQKIHLRFHNNFQVPKYETNKQTDLKSQKTILQLSEQFGRAHLRKRDQPYLNGQEMHGNFQNNFKGPKCGNMNKLLKELREDGEKMSK